MAETQCFKVVVIASGDSVTVYKPWTKREGMYTSTAKPF